ncbi:Uncharacterised protein [Ectopseudomonas mendocina]|uniref:Uncharacterized protein n=1 Tax=Ectopseudomonas mendocina TaxID=300 RepID=A0A379PN73_ECTME|nr:hypothetical protein [Pseudomonas mendocina]SUE95816.1 Uncharacterised protein [Pseudomonas mendocina]
MSGSTNTLNDKDIQVMQLIAEAAASRAVEKQAGALRHEMRTMAESTAEVMATRLSSQLQERMREMELRLRDELGDRMENAIKENLGMNRDDHVQQHRQIAEVIDGYRSVNRTIWSNIIKAVAVIGLAGWVGTSAKDLPIMISKPADRPAQYQQLETPQ